MNVEQYSESYITTEEFCTCADWHYRRRRTGGRCKHQRALFGEEPGDMETAIVPHVEPIAPSRSGVAPGLTRRLTAEQRALLKRQIGGGKLSDDQLDFALGYCQAKGLDALGRDVAIWLQGDRVIIHLTAEGLLKKAAQSRRCEGIDGPWWCGRDGQWREVWLENEPPAAAKWIAYVHGWREPRRGIATYKSFVSPDSPTWKSMPDQMLAIRALTNLLKTCPFEMEAEDFAEVDVRTGEILVAEAETDEADPVPKPAAAPQPTEYDRARAHAGRKLFAAAKEAGLDTENRELMRQIATLALDDECGSVGALDAADRAMVADWIAAHADACRQLQAEMAGQAETLPLDAPATEDDGDKPAQLRGA